MAEQLLIWGVHFLDSAVKESRVQAFAEALEHCSGEDLGRERRPRMKS